MPDASRLHAAGLWALFGLARHAPWTLRLVRPLAIAVTSILAPGVVRDVRANLSRMTTTPAPHPSRVIAAFFDAVADMARFRGQDASALRARVASVTGRHRHLAARESRRGAVFVTAHMGSFEVGLAALTEFEPAVTVVFKRDPSPTFEALRSDLRSRLGVKEAPIDDGWATLIALKTALENDEVIVLQADRAMPGQRFVAVPFFAGHLRMPAGIVTLARLNGSPIIPVFATRQSNGRFAIQLQDAILPADGDTDVVVLRRIAAAMEPVIAAHPEQWLVLHRAFEEDRAAEERVDRADK